METRGPDHSLYPKVVVPLKTTCVPLVSLVKSRVVPAGTTRLSRVIVEHEAFELATAVAPDAPVKVQLEAARSFRGAALVVAASAATAMVRIVLIMVL